MGAHITGIKRNIKEKPEYINKLCTMDSEPLSKESSLWNANNFIITPHVTGGYHLEETLNRIVQMSATNIKNYCEGKEIINKVSIEE